ESALLIRARSAVAELVELRVLELRRRSAADLQRANGPQVAKDPVLQRRRVEIVDARATARSRPPPDHALDHARVPLAEDDEDLLDLDEAVEQLARPGEERELAVRFDEQ